MKSETYAVSAESIETATALALHAPVLCCPSRPLDHAKDSGESDHDSLRSYSIDY